MKYALLGYDLHGSLEKLAAEDKAALHAAHSMLHEDATVDASVNLIAHYRFRPSRLTTTVARGAHNPSRSEGPASDASSRLRALYLVESDSLEAVVEFAGRLPAVHTGATIEIWPLTEPIAHQQRQA